MVEVFKTNIEAPLRAKWLISKIHETFCSYEANFDLDDCENILRVECSGGLVESQLLISFLEKYGCTAVILEDEIKSYPEAGKILKDFFIIPG